MGISKDDHAGYHCHGRREQQVCWTYLSQLGISDGGGVQDEALRKVFHTQLYLQGYQPLQNLPEKLL
jgi:hypothetical protein